MWARNLLFAACCFAGFAALAGGILQGERTIEPDSFRPGVYQREDFRSVIETVNTEFQTDWQDAGLQAAGRADDLTICRRISLALTGTIPSLEEIRAIEAQPAEYRIQWWLSHLLEDRRYADYVGERFARVYVGTDNGPFLVFRRGRFVTWLADQLEANVAYDQIVRQLIADTGLWTDSPAVNFVTATLDQNNDSQPDIMRLTRRVSRAFLGVRLDCVQCHDDHMGSDWLQSDFHELGAFFSEARMSPVGIRDSKKEYEFQYLYEDTPETIPPTVPFYEELLPESGPRRERLARWVTHPDNAAFARTAVHRVWALMFGSPMFEAVDNIPLEGPFPPGLETLAADFVEHDYDLKRLIRLIAATDAFQRDSRADIEVTPLHEARWAAFPLTRLRPEQVAGSLLQASSLTTIDAESHILLRIGRYFQQNEFVKRYGDTGEDEFGAHGGTIPQRLLMMNGNLVKEKTRDNLIGNASTRIAVLAPDDEKAVETAYLTILTRRPSEVELDHFTQTRLKGTRNKARIRALEDMYWTLLNSTEFSWNH